MPGCLGLGMDPETTKLRGTARTACLRPLGLAALTVPAARISAAGSVSAAAGAGGSGQPGWELMHRALRLPRFLDQFALDLKGQRARQPPGGPVPCTTADVGPRASADGTARDEY